MQKQRGRMWFCSKCIVKMRREWYVSDQLVSWRHKPGHQHHKNIGGILSRRIIAKWSINWSLQNYSYSKCVISHLRMRRVVCIQACTLAILVTINHLLNYCRTQNIYGSVQMSAAIRCPVCLDPFTHQFDGFAETFLLLQKRSLFKCCFIWFIIP